MVFNIIMRIWVSTSALVCNECSMAEVHSMTQSMLADVLCHGHVCQLCVDESIAIHSMQH